METRSFIESAYAAPAAELIDINVEGAFAVSPGIDSYEEEETLEFF